MSARASAIGIPGAGLASGAAVQFATSHGLQQRRIFAKLARISQVGWVALAIAGTAAFVNRQAEFGDAGWVSLAAFYVLAIVGPTPLTLLGRGRIGLYASASELAVQGLVRRRSFARSGAGGADPAITTRMKTGSVLFDLVDGDRRGTTIYGLLHIPTASGSARSFDDVNHVVVRSAAGGEWRETGRVVTDENVDEIAAWLASPEAARA